MKDINLERLSTEDIITTYADSVKLACTRNFGLLKSNNKLKLAIKNEHENMENNKPSLFAKFSKLKVESKNQEMKRLRDKFYSNIEAIIENSEEMVDAAYTQSVVTFFAAYQSYYSENKVFKECFDGITILDQEFLKDFTDYNRGKIQGKRREEFSELLTAYVNYVEDTKRVYDYISLKQLIEAYNSDFDYFGNKSITHGKPKRDVALISKKEIEKLFALAEENCIRMHEEVMAQTKLVNNLTKKAEQFSDSIAAKEELAKQAIILQTLSERYAVANSFYDRVDMLKERLDYSNNEWYSNRSFKINRKLKSMFLKPFSRKIKSATDEVYYTGGEATLMEYDSRVLEGDVSLLDILVQRAGGAPSLKKFQKPEPTIKRMHEKLNQVMLNTNQVEFSGEMTGSATQPQTGE